MDMRDLRYTIIKRWLTDLTEVLIEILESNGKLAESRRQHLLTILRKMIAERAT